MYLWNRPGDGIEMGMAWKPGSTEVGLSERPHFQGSEEQGEEMPAAGETWGREEGHLPAGGASREVAQTAPGPSESEFPSGIILGLSCGLLGPRLEGGLRAGFL